VGQATTGAPFSGCSRTSPHPSHPTARAALQLMENITDQARCNPDPTPCPTYLAIDTSPTSAGNGTEIVLRHTMYNQSSWYPNPVPVP
jgi:hypothetical protein